MIEWQPHELLTPPSLEEMAALEPEELVELHRLYHEAIENSGKDPFRYGFLLPNWRRSWEIWREYRTLLLLGANRSGKTTFGARTVVKALLENPGSTIYCFCQNESVSLEVQQAAIYEQLPAELKKKNTGDVHYISYTIQNGFTGNGFILPNKSRCKFLYYTQFQQNQSILEGMELGSRKPTWINVGAWCDEYLGGMELLDRLYLRLATRNAKLLLTFTPKDGITETVSNYLRDAVTIERRDAELLRTLHKQANCEVPYAQTNAKKNTAILYFHTKDNPWSGYESVVEMCQGKGDMNYTLTAAYGVPTKSYSTKFPKFSTAVNVKSRDWIEGQIADYVNPKTGKRTPRVTRYHVIDPAGRKNWFMVWIAVTEDGTWFIYREWPDVPSVGRWAEPGKEGKWKAGEGAKGLGKGYRGYIELIAELEDGEEIAERLIDPRLGAQRYQKEEADSSIIDELNELDFMVTPAPGMEIEDGLQDLVDLMDYDTTRPIEWGTNRPYLYVSEECQNIIEAFAEYTGEGGKNEPHKDPIDVLRYGASAKISHYPEGSLAVETTGCGGY
jgi:hypothetical protein